MSYYEEILAVYHHLLMLDNEEDKEKKWIINYEPKAKKLSTAHFHILSYLLKHQSSSGKEISEYLTMLQGTLSKRLALLVERNFVSSTKDEKDGRGKKYYLTSEGRRLAQIHEQLLCMKNIQLTKQLEKFTPEELEVIQRFLNSIKNVEETIDYPDNPIEPLDEAD
ncbi:MAG: MarR family transcriptional regulator [Tetragenococcus koreensis]|uniref:MarR family winged helix-turn-helix transcriptional regulator n=1 Tax=Tetragenococcus halophilus TaxID=51669 RepID=UPI00209B6B2C|nr:MarR family transcriptional regulator [Tetragenococcus halophilus]MDN6140441.1 MarR family transcriptional regulator [Tetragenococcus koreensis]MDN6385642.1 MarR family transcriptional regulator [Alkalibacterium sp.]MDN6641087.1 MarR family transcriptional regulator [Tetragenococcus sp.]MCO8290500.1 MarR family transcriptional regulator [Tetragenococcus halophilus]MCO8294954.1 MarR family transcriptional regulator [Tetragenococcus halophilus]